MSTSALQVVRHHAEKWRHLLAWGAVLPAVIKVEPYQGGVLGRGNCVSKLALVRVTGNIAEDLATALHELAHVAAPMGDHHGKGWRTLFARAACEAFKLPRDHFDHERVTVTDLDAQVVTEARFWLKRTGQSDMFRLLGIH